eukprot:8598779-Pyramimonas_sp.AAC.1
MCGFQGLVRSVSTLKYSPKDLLMMKKSMSPPPEQVLWAPGALMVPSILETQGFPLVSASGVTLKSPSDDEGELELLEECGDLSDHLVVESIIAYPR